MVTPSIGGVVLVPFPFSDLSQAKRRPALILADIGRGDWLVCQITSSSTDLLAVQIEDDDFAYGALERISFVRFSKLFSIHQDLILKEVGLLKPAITNRVLNSIIRLLQQSTSL